MLLSLNTPTAPEVAHIESPKLRLLSPNCAFCPKIRDGGSTLAGKTRLLSRNPGRWEHFGGENAPSVPKYGTVGALWQGNCALCPEIWDGGSTLTGKLRLLSQNPGRWEHFDGETAPSVPKIGTVGAPGRENCAFCPEIRDGGSTWTGKLRLLSQNMRRWEHFGGETAPGGSLDENVGAGWRVKALGGRTLDVERFTEGARRRVLDGGALNEGALDGGALDGGVLDGRGAG